MHRGEIVALDRPQALLADLGEELLEFRVQGDAGSALAELRGAGLAGPDAFAIGSRVTVPLHGRPAAEVLAGVARAGDLATRAPTLDDVYLRLTGSPMEPAAP